jgi:hypothetical protein
MLLAAVDDVVDPAGGSGADPVGIAEQDAAERDQVELSGGDSLDQPAQ